MEYKQIMKHSMDLWQEFRKAMPECESCHKTLGRWIKDKSLTKREVQDIHEVAFMLLVSEGKASTKASVLAWLMSGQDLNDIIAATKLGCRNLSAMISKLRDEGWAIGKERMKTKAGQMATFYHLAEVR